MTGIVSPRVRVYTRRKENERKKREWKEDDIDVA
jgi:hypothetical protein